MGQGADGDEVNAGFSDRADIPVGYPSGSFHHGPSTSMMAIA